nr:MAG TPA: hypothetical protein [Caudoviricetes sp.]
MYASAFAQRLLCLAELRAHYEVIASALILQDSSSFI